MAGVQKPRFKLKPGVLAAGRNAVRELMAEARRENELKETSRKNETSPVASHPSCGLTAKDIIQEPQQAALQASTSLSPDPLPVGHDVPGSLDAENVAKIHGNRPSEDSRNQGDNSAEDTQPVQKLRCKPGVLAAGGNAVLELTPEARRGNELEEASRRNGTSSVADHQPCSLTAKVFLEEPQEAGVKASTPLSPDPTPVGHGLPDSPNTEKAAKSIFNGTSEDSRKEGDNSVEDTKPVAFSLSLGFPEAPLPGNPSPPVNGTPGATTFYAGRSATPSSLKRQNDGDPEVACFDKPNGLGDQDGMTNAIAGSSAPPMKMARFSGIKRCSQDSSALTSPDFTQLMDKDDWSTLDSKDVTYCVLEEICRAQHARINNLVPRPRANALNLMRSRLQSFFLKSRVAITTYREPFVYKPPEAAYAVDAMSEAVQVLDKEIQQLQQLQAFLNDRKESAALLDKLAGPVIPQPGLAQKSDEEVSPQLDARTCQVFSMLGEAYEILRAKATVVSAFSRKSKILLAEAAAVIKETNEKVSATMQAPKTPHQVFSALQDSVSPE